MKSHHVFDVEDMGLRTIVPVENVELRNLEFGRSRLIKDGLDERRPFYPDQNLVYPS